jgi:Lsr2
LAPQKIGAGRRVIAARKVIATVEVAHQGMEATMATKITVVLEDDLDGGPADETVRFAVDGTGYEIDLNASSAAAFRQQLAPYIEHARRTGPRVRPQPGRTAASRGRSADIRAWAKDQGITLSGRGRIPADIARQYEAAMGGQ